MFFKKSNKLQNRIDTLIGVETRIEGNIHFSGGLRVDGVIHGSVSEDDSRPSTLILSEQGMIEGAITVTQAVINGKVIGGVQVKEFVELQPKARVLGDVYYKSLEMHTGAVIEGSLVYQGEEVVRLLTNKD